MNQLKCNLKIENHKLKKMTDLWYEKSSKWVKKLSKRSCNCENCLGKIYWGVS